MTIDYILQWLWDNCPFVIVVLNLLCELAIYIRTGKISRNTSNKKQEASKKAVKYLNKAKKYADKINESDGDENGNF